VLFFLILLPGIPLHDGLGTKAQVKITYFNAPYGNATAQQILADNIVKDVYGTFSAIMIGFSEFAYLFDYACDLSQRGCLVVHALPPSPDEAICTIGQFTGTLPADCIDRGRRVGSRRFDSYVNVFASSAGYLDTWLGLIYGENPNANIAFITSSLDSDVAVHAQAAATLTDLKLNLVMDEWIPVSPDPITELLTAPVYTNEQAVALVQKMIDADVTGFAFIGQDIYENAIVDPNIKVLLSAMKTLNWIPPAMNILDVDVLEMDPSVIVYSYSSDPWDRRVKGSDFRAFNTSTNLELFSAVPGEDSSQVFTDAWLEAFPAYTDDGSMISAAAGAAMTVLLQKLVESSGSVEPQDLIQAAKFISVPSHWGLLQFDSFGRRFLQDKDVILVQYTDPTNTGPTNAVLPQGVGQAAIFPAPTFDERVYVAGSGANSDNKTTIEYVVIAVNSFCITIALLFMGVTIYYSNHPVIKTSTPSFLVLFCTGVVLFLLSNFFANENQTSSLCVAQIWLLTVGFNLMFSALFVKTMRIYLIFNTSKLQVVKLSNNRLLIVLGLILSLDIILNVIWESSGYMVTKLVTVDPYRPVYDYEVCAGTNGGLPFLVLSLTGKCFLIFCGLILTFLSRNVAEAFNESSYLASAIYATTVVCTLFVPMVASGIGGRSYTYIIRCFGVMFLAISCLLVMYAPKAYLMLFDEGESIAATRSLTEQRSPFTNIRHKSPNNKNLNNTFNTMSLQTNNNNNKEAKSNDNLAPGNNNVDNTSFINIKLTTPALSSTNSTLYEVERDLVNNEQTNEIVIKRLENVKKQKENFVVRRATTLTNNYLVPERHINTGNTSSHVIVSNNNDSLIYIPGSLSDE